VLPGVGVEASSPSLIEKVRSVTTNESGQYRIENLRPGVYAVTFALSGFGTAKREGIELSGTFVATVNAELRVGAVEETVTVSGVVPVVDVQSANRERVLTAEVICHEGWRYPETVRWAVRRGAQVVFHPHAHVAEPGRIQTRYLACTNGVLPGSR